jgi:rare lipoprotein A (peptidoglycan hydrolase)
LAFQVPAATTKTAPPVTSTTTQPPVTSSATGLATWYAEAPPGKCASPWLPFGTVLTVTDIASGASITCTVDDRETAGPPHAVDLSPSGFEGLAPLSQGVVQVNISW